jgi:hypothetical protein
MTKLSERLGLDLTDSLAGQQEVRGDLFESMLAAAGKPEAELQQQALPVREPREASLDLRGAISLERDLVGPWLGIRQKVAQLRILADRCLEGAGLLDGIEDESDFRIRPATSGGQLGPHGLSTQLCREHGADPSEVLHRFDDVQR